MFDRATITLGIDPYSSSIVIETKYKVAGLKRNKL